MTKSLLATAIVAGLLATCLSLNTNAQINPAVMPSEGPLTKRTLSRLLLTDATRIGNRIVAVGDRGYIVYSDSNGESWQRAKTPPNTPLLTAVFFLDQKTGWAVGHDSTILTSSDQGQSWTKSFSAAAEQKPLMDVKFVDANTGFAVGAYGVFYATTDGGKQWEPRKLFEAAKAETVAPASKKGKYQSVGGGKADDADAVGKSRDDDKHINAIIKIGENKLFVAGEAGLLAKSDDGGKSWTKIASPYKGSYFGAIQAQNGAVLIFGLRGNIFRSTDAQLANWKPVENKLVASLMGATRLPDGAIVLTGLSGVALISRDNGESFTPLTTGSTKALSASVLGAPSALLLVGEAGVREVLLTAAASAPAAPAAPAKP